MAIGGWTEGNAPISTMASTNESRDEFVSTTIQYLRTRGFDGLDLDWEYPGSRGGPPEDKENLIHLLKARTILMLLCPYSFQFKQLFSEECKRNFRLHWLYLLKITTTATGTNLQITWLWGSSTLQIFFLICSFYPKFKKYIKFLILIFIYNFFLRKYNVYLTVLPWTCIDG